MTPRPEQPTLLGRLEPVGGGDPIPLVKPKLLVGRHPSCDICLPFKNVSARHCELIYEQGYWTVKDLNSTNGTKVNGQRIHEQRVYPGDELSIAKHRYRLLYTPSPVTGHDADTHSIYEDITRESLMQRAGLVKIDPNRISKPTRRRRPVRLPHPPPPPSPTNEPYGPDETPPLPGAPPGPVSDEELLRLIEDERDRGSREDQNPRP